MFVKACKLFGSSPIERSYHVPTSSEVYNEVNEKYPPKVPIYPLFLTSAASNGIDAGKSFDRRSRFYPDSVNADTVCFGSRNKSIPAQFPLLKNVWDQKKLLE